MWFTLRCLTTLVVLPQHLTILPHLPQTASWLLVEVKYIGQWLHLHTAIVVSVCTKGQRHIYKAIFHTWLLKTEEEVVPSSVDNPNYIISFHSVSVNDKLQIGEGACFISKVWREKKNSGLFTSYMNGNRPQIGWMISVWLVFLLKKRAPSISYLNEPCLL